MTTRPPYVYIDWKYDFAGRQAEVMIDVNDKKLLESLIRDYDGFYTTECTYTKEPNATVCKAFIRQTLRRDEKEIKRAEKLWKTFAKRMKQIEKKLKKIDERLEGYEI